MIRFDLILILAVFVLLQFYFNMVLLKKLGQHEDALKQIGGIVSGMKKEKKEALTAPDPRRSLEWKVKR
ncbi:MAG: hypothetical protein AB1649_03755 [Chloroflexota bacterium]